MMRESTETYLNRLTIIYGLADAATKNAITTFAVKVNKLYDSPDVHLLQYLSEFLGPRLYYQWRSVSG